ncbi:ATP-binding protein [Marinoscillum sp.]|uniref:ATP-binding protein n=1 Tax=Marinoscillum sp. TaxID=2024838 RepID=UPI003BAA0257
MQEEINFHWIKERFFSDEHKKLNLAAGETLLEFNQKNDKLFLVTKGKFQGYLKAVELENYPVFEATKDKFIGVYSYFAEGNLSYSRVMAMEDSEVYYYDKPLYDHTNEELVTLAPFLISVVTNELVSRQHFAKKMAMEKHHDVQRLLKAEKMATLGQMAAGLAHELNNSIGVLDGSLDRLQLFIKSCIGECNDSHLQSFFELGLSKGQVTSSEDARAKRKEYEQKIKGLSSSQARHLAKTGIDPEVLQGIIQKKPDVADKIYDLWETGCTLYDMQVAARHSTHVVRSVKQLGVTEHEWSNDVNVNDTVDEALIIVKNLTKRVNTSVELDPALPHTEACHGQLVQVWINLIKNAVESLIHSETSDPKLHILSSASASTIEVRISDNGPGIPKKIIKRIFEPSFTTKVGGLSFGLGLGLSIVQRIITEHDGQIDLSSEPGHTEFIVKLPLINSNHG